MSATDNQKLNVLKKLQVIYNTNFTVGGLVEGNPNFEMESMFSEALNMLIEAVAEGNMSKETHGTVLSATVLMYVYARKNKIPSIAMVHESLENME